MVVTREGERRRREMVAKLRRERRLAKLTILAMPRPTVEEQATARRERALARKRRRGEEEEEAAGGGHPAAELRPAEERGHGGRPALCGGSVGPRVMMLHGGYLGSKEKEEEEEETLTPGSLGFRLRRVDLGKKTFPEPNLNLNQDAIEELQNDIRILKDIRDGKIAHITGSHSDLESLMRCLEELEDKEEEITSRRRKMEEELLIPKPEPQEEPEEPPSWIYRRYPPTPWDQPIRQEPETRRINRPPCVRDWPVGLQPFLQLRPR